MRRQAEAGVLSSRASSLALRRRSVMKLMPSRLTVSRLA